MKLESNDFNNNEILKKKFTCDGEDISPHLTWSEFPLETKSFALSCFDFEDQHGIVSHWLVINIPIDVTEIPQAGPIPGEEVENHFSTTYYEGPCQADKVHTYHFRIYALNTEKLDNNIAYFNFRKEINAHLLVSAEILARYQSEIKFDLPSCH